MASESFEQLGSTPSPSAGSAWRQLFTGRYRIAGWYDRGGRRYVVARPHADAPTEALTPRQQRFLAARAKGTALKVIAFESGLSIGTVSRELAMGMTRLGLTSTSDLAAVLGHVGR
jgi:DNA-binding NarL/FixJ family response regulator